MTITEALAEIKTIQKRIDKKREFILHHTYRQHTLRDLLEKDGGSPKVVGLIYQWELLNELHRSSTTVRQVGA